MSDKSKKTEPKKVEQPKKVESKKVKKSSEPAIKFDWKSIKACADKELKGKEVKKVAAATQKESILGQPQMRAAFLRANFNISLAFEH